MERKKIVIFILFCFLSFVPYGASVLVFKGSPRVDITTSQPDSLQNLESRLLLVGENTYIFHPNQITVFTVLGLLSPFLLFVFLADTIWLTFGFFLFSKYILLLFNPFAHYVAFLLTGQHGKLLHVKNLTFVEMFVSFALFVILCGRMTGIFKRVQKNRSLPIAGMALFIVLMPVLAIHGKGKADQVLKYRPYALSTQDNINKRLYGKKVVVASDIITSRYVAAILGNTIVGTLEQFNASVKEENSARQRDVNALMGTASFSQFLDLVKKYRVDYVYINNELGIDNFFIENRLRLMNELSLDVTIVDFVVEDGNKILYKVYWDRINDGVRTSFEETAMDQTKRFSDEMGKNAPETMIHALKLSDAFSIGEDDVQRGMARQCSITDEERLDAGDAIDIEMRMYHQCRKKGIEDTERAMYTDVLDSYSQYKEYPSRVYEFLHAIGIPDYMSPKDLREKYFLTSIKVKHNRELVNAIVNFYIQSGLYTSALEVGNQYKVVDSDYGYLNERLKEASRHTGG